MRYKISSQCNQLSLWDSLSMMTGSALQEDIASNCRGAGTQRAGHPGHETGIRNDSPVPMKTKRLLCPQRLRTVPHQFSWIDQRLVREGHIARCGGTQALALYLLLVTVADSQGLSYYADKTAARLLCISEAQLRHARL